jgi:hypothetical protein
MIFIFVTGAIATNGVTNKTGCHNNDVMLNCPSFVEGKFSSLHWKVRDISGGWEKVARIQKNGNRKLYNTALAGRLTIHSNGSLEITSLKPDDETKYLCRVDVEAKNIDVHIIELSVRCDGTL